MNSDSYYVIIYAVCVITLIFGVLKCFCGFKIMKISMSVGGFLIGALIGAATAIISDNADISVFLAIVLGVLLAFLAYKLYLVGVFLLTFFWMSIAMYIFFESVPIALILAGVCGVLAVLFVRPTVIVSTAFSGAGVVMTVIRMLFMSSDPLDLLRGTTDAESVMLNLLWVVTAALGAWIQFVTTRGEKLRESIPKASGLSAGERQYPGMQRAYRNFCIKCGCRLSEQTRSACPQCGYRQDTDA